MRSQFVIAWLRPPLRGELEHEVLGESLDVAFDRLNEGARLNPIKLGQVAVEHRALATDEIDTALASVTQVEEICHPRPSVCRARPLCNSGRPPTGLPNLHWRGAQRRRRTEAGWRGVILDRAAEPA